ncbi:MAG TPA: DUF6496 domain-containing protein [Myxococcaceae bacterium]|jgi:hypothetical protein
MPERQTVRRARRAKRQGKRASTQAGSFVREEMRHVKSGKHGAKNRKQVIAIGLSKARRSGVKVKRKGASAKRRRAGGSRSLRRPTSAKRSRASRRALGKRRPTLRGR